MALSEKSLSDSATVTTLMWNCYVHRLQWGLQQVAKGGFTLASGSKKLGSRVLLLYSRLVSQSMRSIFLNGDQRDLVGK